MTAAGSTDASSTQVTSIAVSIWSKYAHQSISFGE
jgi:hypothetical protein